MILPNVCDPVLTANNSIRAATTISSSCICITISLSFPWVKLSCFNLTDQREREREKLVIKKLDKKLHFAHKWQSVTQDLCIICPCWHKNCQDIHIQQSQSAYKGELMEYHPVPVEVLFYNEALALSLPGVSEIHGAFGGLDYDIAFNHPTVVN